MKNSIYPRECNECSKVYQTTATFYKHNKRGTCERTQIKSTEQAQNEVIQLEEEEATEKENWKKKFEKKPDTKA